MLLFVVVVVLGGCTSLCSSMVWVLTWFYFYWGRDGVAVGYLLAVCLLIVTCMKQEVFVFGLTFSHFNFFFSLLRLQRPLNEIR